MHKDKGPSPDPTPLILGIQILKWFITIKLLSVNYNVRYDMNESLSGRFQLLKLTWIDQLERRCLTLLELLQRHTVNSDCKVVLHSGPFLPSQMICDCVAMGTFKHIGPCVTHTHHQFSHARSSNNCASPHQQGVQRRGSVCLQGNNQLACQPLVTTPKSQTFVGPPFYRAGLFSKLYRPLR